MGLKIDGIATNQNIDSSGEILNVANHDISDFLEGKGVINWEHNNDSPEDIIGHIVYAKKIMKRSDCDGDRQLKYYDLSNGPYVYVIGELFDDEEHPGGVAAAALIRYYHKRKEPVLAGFSIEGHTLERDDNHLVRSVGRRLALTLRSCNKSCVTDVLSDKDLAEVYKKSNPDKPSLIKSIQVDSIVLEDTIEDIKAELEALQKTLTAGSYDVAPSSLTGGAALQVEDRSIGNRVKAAVRDWDKKRPLKEVIKAALPEVSDEYVDHFTRLAEDLTLKKGGKPLMRISAKHSMHLDPTEKHNSLIEGLYLDSDGADHNMNRHVVAKNDSGQEVYVKKPIQATGSDQCPYHKASAYSDLADSVFGMGDHVPVTNHFVHPQQSNAVMSAHEVPQGARSLMEQSMRESDHVKAAHDDGTLHKLAIMDAILGHGHRHGGNTVIDKDGKVMHIDNEGAFQYDTPTMPTYLHDLQMPDAIEKADGNTVGTIGQIASGLNNARSVMMSAQRNLNPKNYINQGKRTLMGVFNPIRRPINNMASAWLMATNPRVLVGRMMRLGLNSGIIQKAAYRLRSAQKSASTGQPIDSIINNMDVGNESLPNKIKD